MGQLVADWFPNVTVLGDCLPLQAERLRGQILRSGCTQVLLAGGPPCTPFSSLGHRRGWDDPRSQPVLKFFELRDGLADLCAAHGLAFVWLMEEVASMDEQTRTHINGLAGHPPILVHAGDWGHVHRARLFWGCCDISQLSGQYFAEVVAQGECAEGVHVARWLGRPVPRHWSPADGYQTVHTTSEGIRGPPTPGTFWAPTYAHPRYHTLTTCFRHPDDRRPADHATHQRFHRDGRRYPATHYTEHNLVWRGSDWRTLSAAERELLMGFPQAYTAELKSNFDHDHKQYQHENLEDFRCHAIGNSFHVPSVMLILALLLHMPTMPNADRPHDEGLPESDTDACLDAWPRGFVEGSCWDDEVMHTFQTEKTAEGILHDMLNLFPKGFFPEAAVQEVQGKAGAISVWPLLRFHRWAEQQGIPGAEQNVDKVALQDRSRHPAAVQRQRQMPGAKACDMPLLPEGLTPEQHMAAASKLTHPFDQPPCLENDLAFALEGIARLGPRVGATRSVALGTLRTIKRWLRPLERHALAARPKHTVGEMSPTFVAFFVALFDWADKGLPMKLVEGFEISGDLEPSFVHHAVEHQLQDGASARRELLGANAIDYVDKLEHQLQPHSDAEKIQEETLKEVANGLAGPAQDRTHVDSIYGRGRWRPLPRHVIEQGGKYRPIDDGRRAGHNSAASMRETITCQTSEFVVLAAKSLIHRLAQLQVEAAIPDQQCLPQCWPDWLELVVGVEDMWKGFRQNHATQADRALCVITYVTPQGRRRYHQLYGLPFGLGAVANQFNRAPLLFTAVLRRCLGLAAAHYFDDNATLDLRIHAAMSKTMVVRTFGFFGVKLSTDKRKKMQCIQSFLGLLNDMSRMRDEHCIGYGCKASTRAKALRLLRTAIDQDYLSPAQASKIRGVVQWIDTGLFGRPCRGLLTAFTARQYWEISPGWQLSQGLRTACATLICMIMDTPDRLIYLFRRLRPPLVLYTDASAQGREMRIGILLVRAHTTCLCFSADVPSHVVEEWAPREQYIGQGELLAGPLALAVLRAELSDQSVIWLIDNQSAMTAMIKGASPIQDNCRLAVVLTMLLNQNSTKAWFEFVDTAANPSDGLSRGGYADPEVQARLASGAWLAADPPCVPWVHLLRCSQERIEAQLTALGGA